jgi:hypothetical protein
MGTVTNRASCARPPFGDPCACLQCANLKNRLDMLRGVDRLSLARRLERERTRAGYLEIEAQNQTAEPRASRFRGL